MLVENWPQLDLDALGQSSVVFSVPDQNRSGDATAEWTTTTTCLCFEDALTQDGTLANNMTGSDGRGTGDEKPWPAFKQPLYAVALLAVAYVLVAVVGVVSNAIVVTVIYRQPKMRSVTNYFLSNLAIADILVCILVLPITLLQNIYTEWWYGPVLCKAVPYLQGVSVSASVNTLGAVAVERFLATFYPQTSKMTPRTALIVIAMLWTIPGVLFVPWIIVYRQKAFVVSGLDYVVCHAEWTSDAQSLTFTLGVVFFTCYLLPLVFIGIFYLMIAVRVWRRNVRGISGSRAERNIHRSKTRILLMLAVVFVVFALSWLPLYSINLYVQVESPLEAYQRLLLKNYLAPIAQWLGASNSCVNPFIYCCFSHHFRKSFLGVITTIRRRHRRASSARSVRATDIKSTNELPF